MTPFNGASFSFTDQERWAIVNSLAMNYFQFARISSLYHRAYGVLTDADEGINAYSDTVLNNCVREELERELVRRQIDTEMYLGYNLTERYHDEEDMELPLNRLVYLPWPGIESLNVAHSWSDISTGETVSFYIAENVSVAVVDGRYQVTVPISVAPNPYDIFLRRNSDFHKYEIDWSRSPVKSGTDWILTIDTTKTVYNGTDQINVQHKKHILLEYTFADEDELNSASIMYPGTEEKVPVLNTVVDGLTVTYYLPIYALVDQAFAYSDRVVDLRQEQFFKLYDTVDILGSTETALTGVTVTERYIDTDGTNATQTYTVNAAIMNKESSLIRLEVDPIETDISCRPDSPTTRRSIRVQYKTDPENLDPQYRKHVNSLGKAIGDKIAANLPLQSCGCDLIGANTQQKKNGGWIGEMQEEFPHVKETLIGKSAHIEPGRRRGDYNYHEKMKTAPVYRAPFSIPT